MNPDIDQHIQQCLEGRLDSFEVIVREYEPKVRAVLAAMIPDSALIPDLTQEVFVITYQKLGTFKAGTNFNAWIKTITRNVAQNERRKWYRRQEMQERLKIEAEAEQQIGENIDAFVDSLPEETLDALRDCVGGLQGKTRALVDGYYYDGCSIKQVSEILQVSASAAKVALHRARAAVSKCLQKKGGAQDDV
jgi:RNA polymerase sigma-70 factor (ECF subfamily)